MYVFFYMCVLFVMCMKVRLREEGQGACVRHFPRISKYCAIFLIKFVVFLFLLSQKKGSWSTTGPGMHVWLFDRLQHVGRRATSFVPLLHGTRAHHYYSSLFQAICPDYFWARDNRWFLSRIQRLARPAGDRGLLSRLEGGFYPGWWL